MAWARVDDGWWSHPKVMGLTLTARGLWVSALSWSCHQRKDKVPSGFLFLVGGDTDQADELVEAGLWRPVEGGWIIHDWADYQEKTTSEKRAEAGAKGGKRSGQVRRGKQTSEANGKQTEVASEATDEAGTRPDPTHPIPALPVPSDDASSQTTTDDLQSVGPSSVVVEVAHHMAELLWKQAANVHPSKHTRWVESTEANIIRERTVEIERESLRWAHIELHDLADGLVNDRWPSPVRLVPDVEDSPYLGPFPPPKPPMSQDDYVAGVRARAEAGDPNAIGELAVWERRAARKALQALGGSR